ncbi:ribonuclease P protein subunit p30 [Macrobrachium rosenbergii]|uniref:ribonuclease P protein subunit p30 n=1 Tax=Macrobrachium rosenbergii TaxID=79674 RepID=UPI0034D74F5A
MKMLRTKGFCDLNIPATEAVKDTVLRALSLGYQTVAINQYVTDKTQLKEGTSKKRKKGKDGDNESLVPPPKIVELSDLDLKRYKITRKPVILSRITITHSDPSSPFLSKYANAIRQYDLIAIIPENDAVLKQIIFNKVVDVDIISLSPDGSSFRVSRSLLKSAVERDIYLELCYSPCITDVVRRKRTIALSHFLHRASRSSNIIITSQAVRPTQLRYPYDVMNVGRFLGLTELAAKSALSYTAHNAIYCATVRRKNISKSGAEVAVIREGEDGQDAKYEGLNSADNFVVDMNDLEQVKKKKKIFLVSTDQQPRKKKKKNKKLCTE